MGSLVSTFLPKKLTPLLGDNIPDNCLSAIYTIFNPEVENAVFSICVTESGIVIDVNDVQE